MRIIRWTIAALAVAALAMLTACQAHAEGAAKGKGKIAATKPAYTPAPYAPLNSPPEPETWRAHNWYVGLVGGYAWQPDDKDDDGVWHGGIVGGYLWRNGPLGLGVEADYVVRDLGALDEGVASLRARAGVFVGATFVYGTAGVHETWSELTPDELRRGLVVGGGVEREIAKGLALRAEVLHYRHADEYVAWGDDGSTAARVGAVVKF